MTEIHEEISELLEKKYVCTNRVLVPGFHASPRRSEIVMMEMDMEMEKNVHLIIFSLKGRTL